MHRNAQEGSCSAECSGESHEEREESNGNFLLFTPNAIGRPTIYEWIIIIIIILILTSLQSNAGSQKMDRMNPADDDDDPDAAENRRTRDTTTTAKTRD